MLKRCNEESYVTEKAFENSPFPHKRTYYGKHTDLLIRIETRMVKTIFRLEGFLRLKLYKVGAFDDLLQQYNLKKIVRIVHQAF